MSAEHKCDTHASCTLPLLAQVYDACGVMTFEVTHLVKFEPTHPILHTSIMQIDLLVLQLGLH